MMHKLMGTQIMPTTATQEMTGPQRAATIFGALRIITTPPIRRQITTIIIARGRGEIITIKTTTIPIQIIIIHGVTTTIQEIIIIIRGGIIRIIHGVRTRTITITKQIAHGHGDKIIITTITTTTTHRIIITLRSHSQITTIRIITTRAIGRGAIIRIITINKTTTIRHRTTIVRGPGARITTTTKTKTV